MSDEIGSGTQRCSRLAKPEHWTLDWYLLVRPVDFVVAVSLAAVAAGLLGCQVESLDQKTWVSVL